MAKLKENSTILKSTGEEIIATEESVDRKLLLKADKDYVDTQLNTKVDKVAGKQLSTEDYTTEEKNKLAGIEEGANNYVHPSEHPASIIKMDNGNTVEYEIESHKNDNTPHREAVSIERKNPDDDGVFTLIEFRRSDGTLFKTSQLNGISPYTSRTVKYYDENENLMQTVEYSITYSNDEVVSEVIISA